MRLLWLLLALLSVGVARADDSPPVARYAASVERLARRRVELASEHARARTADARAEVLSRAREALLSAIDGELFPAWLGTPWEFHGTTETPGEGAIACGYFVSTVLRDAGLRVERVRLAQQASELIVKTLSPSSEILRFRNRRIEEVLAAVRERGDGLYVVGLDFHVAFLRIAGDRAELCHSSVFEPVAVVCEPAAEAQGMVSRYHVVGRLFTDRQLLDWLGERPIATVR